ncbi:MAG: ATP-dependent DNA helicase RecG [Candidatus Omnitrophica bacterium]|nr:ATP-dependent DNA helicase RecG [Candidatus Omnitrophota bacterium]
MMRDNSALKTPVRYFKGVGPKRGELLSKLGIETAEDILYYLPLRYEDRSNLTAIKDLRAGEHQTVEGEVITCSSRIAKSGMRFFQVAVTDGTGFVHATWFNQPYLKDYFKKGQRVILYGKIELHDKLQITQPEYEIVESEDTDSIHIGRIVPIYSAADGLAQRYLRGLADTAVAKYSKFLVERLPTYILAREKLVDSRFAVRNIHFPTTFENLEKAYRRIVFEEFFVLQLALAMKKRGAKRDEKGLGHNVSGELIDSFRKSLPFELTDGQKKAMADISRDMSSTKPMNRLLEGDVGSGKTVVAAYGLVLTVQNGFQGVIMAPTEVLARQHFIGLSELLMPLGINISLLIGGMKQEQKREAAEEIRSGKVDIVVGTHSVIQESVQFKKMGLAVVDEQHKFGVTQRAILKEKGYNPHILVMTATPIPRTLALTVYGDLDVSIIRELPKGRKPIQTYWVEEARRDEAYDFVKEEIGKGRQAYIVCPSIDGQIQNPKSKIQNKFQFANSNSKAGSAEGIFNDLKSGVFADYKIGMLHGRMPSSEKEKVMKDFKNRKIDVLVSTVVIEVGIDVPNATVMMIENAERFGLAQLHQLRGRVGRGEHESFCILLANPKTEGAAKRIGAIEDTLDGFQIAEEDLNIRGPGEFFGTRQHGLPEIKFGNILKDFAIMERARHEAFDLVRRDPDLSEEHHRLLKETLAERFKGKICES